MQLLLGDWTQKAAGTSHFITPPTPSYIIPPTPSQPAFFSLKKLLFFFLWRFFLSFPGSTAIVVPLIDPPAELWGAEPQAQQILEMGLACNIVDMH